MKKEINELKDLHNHFLQLLREENITPIQREYIQRGLMKIFKLIQDKL